MGPLTTMGVATPSTGAERSKLTPRAASSPRQPAPPTTGDGAVRALGAGVFFSPRSGDVFASAVGVGLGAGRASGFSAERARPQGASGTSGVAGGRGATRVQATENTEKISAAASLARGAWPIGESFPS